MPLSPAASPSPQPFWAASLDAQVPHGRLTKLWRGRASPTPTVGPTTPVGGMRAPTPKAGPPRSPTAASSAGGIAGSMVERLREDPLPPSHSLPPRPATAGVAVVKRIDPPLRPLRAVTGKDSPRPACDLMGSPPRAAREPPYSAVHAQPLRCPVSVESGFDKMTHSLGEVMGRLPDVDTLDHRWIRVGKWVDRYFVDQTPGVMADRLDPVLESVMQETSSLIRPNLPVVSASCALLRQTLLMLSSMWPRFGSLTSLCFRHMIDAIFINDPLSSERRPPKMLLDEDDEELRRQLLSYSGKTYFQALRELSKRLGQTTASFEQREKERGKLIEAMDKIVGVWQRMFKCSYFKAWKMVKSARLRERQWEERLKDEQAEVKALKRRQLRVDELVEEVRQEKNAEIHVLRAQTVAAEKKTEELKARTLALEEVVKQKDEDIAVLKKSLADLRVQLVEQRRTNHTRYAKLASAAYGLVDRMRWPDWESRRLEAWQPYFAPFEEKQQYYGMTSPTGDPEPVVDWVNSMAAQHPSFAEYNVDTVEWLIGGMNTCNVWACVLGVLAPGIITRPMVVTVLEEVRLDLKASGVVGYLRELGVPKVIDCEEMMREGPDMHHMLAIVLMNRFLRADMSLVSGCPEFLKPPDCSLPEPPPRPRGWEPAEDQAETYTDSSPMPPLVQEYLNMTAGALQAHFELVQYQQSRGSRLARMVLNDSLEGYMTAVRHRSVHGQGLSKLEQLDRPRFLDLRYELLSDIAKSEAEVMGMRRVLRRNFRHLRKVFRYYAGSDSRATDMSYDEMWRLVSDCGVPSKGVFDRTTFRVAFSSSDVESEKGAKQSLDPTEFSHALVRIAHMRLRHKIEDTAEQFATLLEKFILPEACYSDPVPFKQSLREPLPRNVLERRANDMVKVFKHYAGIEMTDKSTSLSFKEFMRMMMDCKVIDEVCTHHALQNIFVKIQDEDAGAGGHMEMVYHEFVDAICAVAIFKSPAPYMPVHIRVQRFWQNWVLPALRKQLKLTDGVAGETGKGEKGDESTTPTGQQ
eukprot:TRINITY_DN47264_c0_g1_i1.p1 TRINITY_DN47264_c0_g1~~TRINITY_DN47264_c0_g1_i1.p1  ORF type:complete len:1031 (+),score=311.25 TRINITY_DN47264_c0_g1_i1:65-3157(+)